LQRIQSSDLCGDFGQSSNIQSVLCSLNRVSNQWTIDSLMKFERFEDAELIRRIANAETGALEELYDRYNRLVFSVALTILGDHATAEEITLDVFVRVWKGAATYHAERAKVTTWLAAITRHHAIDILRGQRTHLDQKSLYLNDLPWQKESAGPDPQQNAENDSHARLFQGVLPSSDCGNP
jgi:RNA polymerase sigma factor (sigma-70 family)